MTIGFIVMDVPEIDILVCAIILSSAIVFSPNVEISSSWIRHSWLSHFSNS